MVKKNKLKKKNKKASDLVFDTFLKIVIAIICILALIYVGVMLVGIFTADQNLPKANNSISEIKYAFQKAKDKGGAEAYIMGPSYWNIIAWPIEGSYGKPNSCTRDKYCICICEAVGKTEFNTASSWLSHCNSKGVCLDSNDKINLIPLKATMGRVYIENPPIELKINYTEENGYEVKETEI